MDISHCLCSVWVTLWVGARWPVFATQTKRSETFFRSLSYIATAAVIKRLLHRLHHGTLRDHPIELTIPFVSMDGLRSNHPQCF